MSDDKRLCECGHLEEYHTGFNGMEGEIGMMAHDTICRCRTFRDASSRSQDAPSGTPDAEKCPTCGAPVDLFTTPECKKVRCTEKHYRYSAPSEMPPYTMRDVEVLRHLELYSPKFHADFLRDLANRLAATLEGSK